MTRVGRFVRSIVGVALHAACASRVAAAALVARPAPTPPSETVIDLVPARPPAVVETSPDGVRRIERRSRGAALVADATHDGTLLGFALLARSRGRVRCRRGTNP